MSMNTAVVPWGGASRTAANRQPIQFDIEALVDLADRLSTVEGFVPKGLLNRPPAVLATLLAGNELGLGPMESLRAIHVIEGRVALSAEVGRALVLAAGHHVEIVESDDQHCVVRGARRDGTNWTTVEWTMDRANRAQLASRQNWRHYPRQMLAARATSELCRLMFPDALAGLEVFADEEESELAALPPVDPDETPAPARPKGRTRKANIPAPTLVPPSTTQHTASLPAPATTSVPVPAPGTDVGSEPPAPAEGGDVPPPPAEPDPEVEGMLADVREMRSGLIPQWQRRLHARVGEVFSGADQATRDAYRHAIVAVTTRARDTGPVASSSELTQAELAGFDAILNFIERGECLIALLESGAVEVRQGGWCYRVSFDPLEIKTIREAG